MEENNYLNGRKKHIFIYLVICLLSLFSIQIIASYFFISKENYGTLDRSLAEFTDRITHDLSYQDGTWNMSKYNSDPSVPYPNSPNSFPLYIITNNGYVIERSKPVKGFLDASDYSHLINFVTPETILSPTNEQWRIYSKILKKNGTEIGVVGVSYYNPQVTLLPEIDRKLASAADYIATHLQNKNNTLILNNFDIRNVPYDVSFEIVDKYNQVILNNGRFPSYIDPSYVSQEFANVGTRIIKDKETNDEYRVKSSIMYDANHNPVSLVVTAKSIEPIKSLLHEYLVSAIILSCILLLPFSLLIFYFLRRELAEANNNLEPSVEKMPDSIIFNKTDSAFHLDDKVIPIPYASNQYYLCEAIFSNLKKRWEQDELLEKFGETVDSVNARKMYDAMLAVNKKLGLKVIIYKDKTYRINPELLDKIEQK